MPYWQLFYHLVWSTKQRQPLITPEVEPHIYRYLVSKATGLNGVVFAIGGVEDHVHMVVAIPPSIAVANFVGKVKGTASTRLNKSGISTVRFEWQGEYGAFSFDAKRLPNYISYVKKQKEHHAKGTLIPVLERASGENIGPRLLRETRTTYATDEERWWHEMLRL
jgi:REP element-mobilizing transposase RayT